MCLQKSTRSFGLFQWCVGSCVAGCVRHESAYAHQLGARGAGCVAARGVALQCSVSASEKLIIMSGGGSQRRSASAVRDILVNAVVCVIIVLLGIFLFVLWSMVTSQGSGPAEPTPHRHPNTSSPALFDEAQGIAELRSRGRTIYFCFLILAHFFTLHSFGKG